MNAASQPDFDPVHNSGRRVEDDPRAIERDEEHLRQVGAELDRDEKQFARDLQHDHPRPSPKHEHRVEMNYHPLTLHGVRLTGLEIKEQAITAVIPNIQLNFHLTVERAGKDAEHTIGDDEYWTVHDGDCFTAVKPDDNS
ncbi:MAG TPA: hypothetical protein VGB75_08855 [Jatrophihabitans sp.]|jgi:hypothetical protein|uniref:hypothetical protein n=1 Tax=Jatrophihabitans sp. TaxID=1932789 RepID=UPI002EFC3677